MIPKIINVAGARPNFMKIGPIHRALEASDAGFDSRIVHTGQHYDDEMSDVFFRQLELPQPDVHLGVGSASHAAQTARIMEAFEPVVEREGPDLVLVVGDVNSTVACGLVAAKLHVPVAHVEAGLRSFDRRMPEEINRVLTDRLSDLLFVTERSGVDNLRAEGVDDGRIHFVGNVMIDSLVAFREKAAESTIRRDLELGEDPYALMTMHRPSNVDDRASLLRVVEMMKGIAARLTLVFPMHPRTRAKLHDHGMWQRVQSIERAEIVEPLGYLDFLHLMEHAAVVVTDSGGIQEETTYLQVPCLTVRENTERPATVEIGTNELLPLDPGVVADRVEAVVANGRRSGQVPPLWDGRAADRIVDVLERELQPRREQASGD